MTVLQIATGRLFKNLEYRENRLRGILYSNALLLGAEKGLELFLGRLIQTTAFSSRPNPLIYEFTERIEGKEIVVGTLASLSVEPYLQEMAMIVSFALQCTCSPDPEAVRRLTISSLAMARSVMPSNYVKRYFDAEIFIQRQEQRELVALLAQLLRLDRRSYLAAMRAIQTFVTGLHRFGEDPALAYTLLVASVEALAQEFDGHEPEWSEVDHKKRTAIDAVLCGAAADLASGVRVAILEFEHVALKRRFREFVLSHLDDAYFQAGLGPNDRPIAKSEIEHVLKAAYDLRSGYIHTLSELPRQLTTGADHGEWVYVDRKPLLSAQGMARLMRHVIKSFIMSQPTVEAAPYDYWLEQPGIATAELDPIHWVANTNGDLAKAGNRKFEAVLSQVAAHIGTGQRVTDMRPLLKEVDRTIDGMSPANRRPYLAIWAIFMCLVGVEGCPNLKRRAEQGELHSPSVVSLLAYVVFEVPAIDWPIDVHQAKFDEYFETRFHANGIKASRFIEAGAALKLAERYRALGNASAATNLVKEAALNFPESCRLAKFAVSFNVEAPIQWARILVASPALDAFVARFRGTIQTMLNGG